MALIHCHFYSEVLGLSCTMNVILPQPSRDQMPSLPGTRRHPTLWLLHGHSDDHSVWQRYTSIERYVAPLGLAVVMPAADRSCYTDMHRGARYWTFFSEELPELARSFFPLSDRREDNFVAGLSMGGYGAFKLALRCPERYAAAASLSGVLDMAHWYPKTKGESRRETERVFGPMRTAVGSDNDILHLASELARSDRPRPRLYQWCGTDDAVHGDLVTFDHHARGLGLEVTTRDGPGGHDWQQWDREIQRVLEWLLPTPSP